MSEDCLSLTTGSGRQGAYDGTALAKRGVLVVSINYRLGVQGYLAHPQSTAESAGALSVMYLMASPLVRGLFAKAIAESAYMISTPELRGSPFGDPPTEATGSRLAAELGANDLAALRAMEPRALTDAAVKAGYIPFGTIDGRVLTRQLVDVFDRGEQAHVPLLTGFNSGEIRSLPFLAPPLPADASAYTTLIRERYADSSNAFLTLYPPTDLLPGMYELHEEVVCRRRAKGGIPWNSNLGVAAPPLPAKEAQCP